MNEQLEQVEQQLEDMPLAQRIGLYVVILGCIVYMSWNLFGEDMSNEISTKEETITSLHQKLKKNSIKSLEKAIKKAKKEQLKLTEDITNLNFKDQFIKSKLDALGFIYFSQKGKAEVLDNILKESLKNSLNVEYIVSVDTNIKFAPHITQRQEIEIQATGSFKGILSLLQYVDSLQTLMQLKTLSVYIDDDSNTVCNIKLIQYGANL